MEALSEGEEIEQERNGEDKGSNDEPLVAGVVR